MILLLWLGLLITGTIFGACVHHLVMTSRIVKYVEKDVNEEYMAAYLTQIKAGKEYPTERQRAVHMRVWHADRLLSAIKWWL